MAHQPRDALLAHRWPALPPRAIPSRRPRTRDTWSPPERWLIRAHELEDAGRIVPDSPCEPGRRSSRGSRSPWRFSRRSRGSSALVRGQRLGRSPDPPRPETPSGDGLLTIGHRIGGRTTGHQGLLLSQREGGSTESGQVQLPIRMASAVPGGKLTIDTTPDWAARCLRW